MPKASVLRNSDHSVSLQDIQKFLLKCTSVHALGYYITLKLSLATWIS